MNQLKKLTQNLTILYVEDEENSREQLCEIFHMLFKSTDTAFDGEDAYEKYKQKTYDIVITDINMPRISGLELIKKIKAINPKQNIIIISAHNNSEYLMEAIDLGVDNFIMKPLRIEQLNNALEKVADLIYANKLMERYSQNLEEEVEAKTAKLAHQYVTDELTGLLNRNALLKKFNSCEDKTIMLLSIDNFENINITYGYERGDLVLKEIANILQSQLPKKSKLYRISSNEFAMLSSEYDLQTMKTFAKQIQQNIIEHDIIIEDFTIKISVTIALAQGNHKLLQNANIALKEAQNLGHNRINIYHKNSSIELLQVRIQEYMPKLRRIIANKYIVPYFQPIINNKTGKVEKYECLARILDDNNQVQSPLEFIDIAELTGMLPELTRIMIDKSFKVFQNQPYEFSINISEYDLNDGYLREYLAKKLKQYNIQASQVVLEVLEGISAIGAKNGLEQLLNLKEDGFSIAIDDFGVQHSNFERVHLMQVDYLKIDGSFIKNIHTDTKSYHVAKTISSFGKSIGAKVIAEYVHCQEVQDIILELGIDYSQGFYFSEPLNKLQ
jgi:diguanylate cyclase (GGDEF)-like protein